jgi:hypothetical protein
MKIEFEVKDPKYKDGELVMGIYWGKAYISHIRASSISLHYYTANKDINKDSGWVYYMQCDDKLQFLQEGNVYLLSDIEQDIEDLGREGAANKRRISVSYIEQCIEYIARLNAEWEADGRSEALGS